jgi:SynChlorMet cassette radical SAM/SPASM protein ScmF
MTKPVEAPQIEKNKNHNKYDIPAGVPPLTTFYLYMTTGCNLFCQHCWITPSFVKGKPTPGQFIDIKDLKNAVKEGKTLGLNNAKFTGGEPLLHPQFVEILDYMSSKDLKLTMETNATLIDASLAKHMKQNSTLWHISTSLDSHRPEFHDKFRGSKGAFKKTIKGIEHLVNAGYKPQVIMSPHKENIDDLDELIKLAVSLGAGSVKFNPVTPTGRGKTMVKDGKTLNYDEIINLVRYIRGELQDKYSIQLHISLPPALSTIREMLALKNTGGQCHVLSILGLLGSGEMALCGIGRNIPELCFGELGKDSLREVWISHPTLVKLRDDLNGDYPGICGDCIHSHRCQTECVAINYSLTGKLVAPYHLCEETAIRGKFPETRRRSFNLAKNVN